MASSPARRVAPIGARAPQWLAALTLLVVAAALAFAAVLAPAARADAPSITVTVDQAGSSATQTHIKVAGKGFPPNTAFTYTFASFDPFQGTTDANGNAYAASTVTWNGPVVSECDTISITAGSVSASTSITVGAASDSQTGQVCGTPTSSGGSTPTVDATAAAQASATAAAATPAATTAAAAPAPSSTDSSGSSPTTGLRAKLAKLPLGLIGGGVAVLFLVIILVVAMSRRGGDDYRGGYSSPGARSGYRPVPRQGNTGYRQAPPRQGPPRGPDRGGPTYGRRY